MCVFSPKISNHRTISSPHSRLAGKYAGGVRVDNDFREYLTRKFYNGSQTGDEYKDEMIEMGLQDFRRSAKTVFESSEDPCQVNIGSRCDNIEELSVKKGRMSIPGCVQYLHLGGFPHSWDY